MKNKLCVSKTLIITLKGPIMTPNKYDESSSGWMSRQSHNYQYTQTTMATYYNGMWHTAWGHHTLCTGSWRVVMVDCCEVRLIGLLWGIFIWHIANIYIHLVILIWWRYCISKSTASCGDLKDGEKANKGIFIRSVGRYVGLERDWSWYKSTL